MQNPRFQAGEVDTKFLERESDLLREPVDAHRCGLRRRSTAHARADARAASSRSSTCCAHRRRSRSRSATARAAIVPLESAGRGRSRARSSSTRGEVRLAGERKMLIDPRLRPRQLAAASSRARRWREDGPAHDDERHRGAAGLQGARDVVVASYVNLSAVRGACARRCAAARTSRSSAPGRDKQFSLEDAACAGRYVRASRSGSRRCELNDGRSPLR